MPLSDEQVKEIAQKVIQGLPKKDESAPESPESEGSQTEAPEGEIALFDEPDREGSISSRLVASYLRQAILFDTEEELKTYLKQHPDADKSRHHVKPQVKKGPGVETESKGGKPGESEPGEKKPVKQPEPGEKKPEDGVSGDRKPITGPQHEISLEDVVKDPENWATHSIHKSQLTPGVVVHFPGGESKKYGDLSDDEKERVDKAIADGKAASKGLNDYSDRSMKTVKANMQRNLARYENPDVEETKNTSREPLTKDNAEEFSRSLLDNAHSVLDKYASSMSSVSRPMMDKYVENVVGSVYEAASDGSLGEVSQADLDEFVREDLKRMIHQEIETRRRSLGDHGIRHAATNAENSVAMLDQLQGAGLPISGRDKLMALSIQANHDLGYTSGDIATDVKSSKQHRGHSEVLMREEPERYKAIFGDVGAESMAHITGTHDENDIDWEEQPVASAVRLADSTALFGKEKVQDLFIRSPKAMNLACKMRLAAEADPGNDDLQKGIKKQMHDTIDEGDFDDEDKELLHRQVDEMTEKGFSTTTDILSRFSGRIKGFNYDADSKVMSVNMAYSPEGQTVDMLFGDKVAGKQFKKFVEDMGGEPVDGKRGNVEFESNGKPAFRLNMEGADEDPIDSATTDQMKEFTEKTARMEIMKARSGILPPPEMVRESVDESFEFLKKSKSKFTDEEWKKMEELFKKYANEPERIIEELAHWPLLEFERAYLEGKVARIVDSIVAAFRVEDLAAEFSRKGIVFHRRFQVGGESFPEVLDVSKEVGTDFRRDVVRLLRMSGIRGRLGVWQHRTDSRGHYVAVLFVPQEGVSDELADVLKDMGVEVEGA